MWYKYPDIKPTVNKHYLVHFKENYLNIDGLIASWDNDYWDDVEGVSTEEYVDYWMAIPPIPKD